MRGAGALPAVEKGSTHPYFEFAIRLTYATTAVLVTLLVLTGAAQAAPDDPWVAYVANSVVNRDGRPSPVILRVDPVTGETAEVSRNGAQGDLFRHPYDIAVAPGGGSLYVADMGEFASGPAPAADGRVIRVDLATGQQSLVSLGGQLVDPAGVALAPNGSLYVVENVGVGGNPRGGVVQAAVVRINPATGAQAVITRADELCYPFGIAVNAQGRILVSDFGNLVENSVPIITCDPTGGGVIGVDPATGQQAWLSSNSATLGQLFLGPVGLTLEPSGTVLVVNQRSAPAAVTAVNPANGVQQVITPNVSPTDAFEQPQRVAVAPDGNLLVSDYSLNTLEGGLVSVNRGTGAARVFRSSSLFNNPLGLAIVVNREPTAALSFTPRMVGGGRPVTFDASASTDPEGLGLRYQWDLDGNRVFETSTGSQPRVTRTFDSSTTLVPRVRVTDPHGATAERRASRMLEGRRHPPGAEGSEGIRAAAGRPRPSGRGERVLGSRRRPSRSPALPRVGARAGLRLVATGGLRAQGQGPLREPAASRPPGPAVHALAEGHERRPRGGPGAGEPALHGQGPQAPAAQGPLPGGGGGHRRGRQPLEAQVGPAQRCSRFLTG